MKKVISLLIVSTFIFGARNIDNLMYIKPGMAMQEIHELIERPYNVRATKINDDNKVFTIHQHYLKKKWSTTTTSLSVGILSGVFFGLLSFGEDVWLNAIGGGSFMALFAAILDRETTGHEYWFFYEDDELVFFCKPGDWETTAPPTLRVQWQDLN